jgi:uncharacterized membrane-anchored protein YhcB (DUF1043 family)
MIPTIVMLSVAALLAVVLRMLRQARGEQMKRQRENEAVQLENQAIKRELERHHHAVRAILRELQNS